MTVYFNTKRNWFILNPKQNRRIFKKNKKNLYAMRRIVGGYSSCSKPLKTWQKVPLLAGRAFFRFGGSPSDCK